MNGALFDTIANTPMRDVVRFRFTGRLSLARAIAHAHLPAAVESFIIATTRKTRLWRLERVDVARELAAHFQDGLAAGRSPEQLIADFGDPAVAARLIRRAKKRSRHWTYRGALRTLQGIVAILGLFLLVYGVAAIRVFASSPTISRNYSKEFNDAIKAAPAAEVAWPQYRAAGFALPVFPKALSARFPEIRPGMEEWPAAVSYIKEAAPALDLVRSAAERRIMGFPMSDGNDAEFERNQFRIHKELVPADAPPYEPMEQPGSENPMLLGVLLPDLGYLRNYARHLKLDAIVAQSEGDGARALADIRALIGMARQLHDDGILIQELVAFAVFQVAITTTGEILRDSPACLTDDQWVAAAHLLASACGGGDLSVSLEWERRMFHDLIQRMYTDDGRGDGHLTAEGARLLDGIAGDLSHPPVEALAAPISGVVLAGRKDMLETYDRCLDEAIRVASRPLWERARPAIGGFDAIERSQTMRMRYLPIGFMMPAVGRAVINPRRVGMMRDGVLTAIAVEMHKRRTGAYPDSLPELSATLLPRIPTDIFSGRPINYVLRDGRPVIYSIGNDFLDNGGVVESPEMNDVVGAWPPAMVPAVAKPPAGDWILFPQPIRTPQGTTPGAG